MKLRPSEIRYSQDSIKAEFSESWHGTIVDVFEDIIDGNKDISDLGSIQVGQYLGNWVCFEGNRRLFIFKVRIITINNDKFAWIYVLIKTNVK